MEPSVSSCDDVVGVGSPDKRFGIADIVLDDESFDGFLKIDDRMEDAVLEPTSGQLGKEPQTHLARIERERHQTDLAVIEDDDLDFEDPAAVAERARQFAVIKELLTAPALGTS